MDIVRRSLRTVPGTLPASGPGHISEGKSPSFLMPRFHSVYFLNEKSRERSFQRRLWKSKTILSLLPFFFYCISCGLTLKDQQKIVCLCLWKELCDFERPWEGRIKLYRKSGFINCKQNNITKFDKKFFFFTANMCPLVIISCDATNIWTNINKMWRSPNKQREIKSDCGRMSQVQWVPKKLAGS